MGVELVGGKEGRSGGSREPEWSRPMVSIVPECRECITWRRLQVRRCAAKEQLAPCARALARTSFSTTSPFLALSLLSSIACSSLPLVCPSSSSLVVSLSLCSCAPLLLSHKAPVDDDPNRVKHGNMARTGPTWRSVANWSTYSFNPLRSGAFAREEKRADAEGEERGEARRDDDTLDVPQPECHTCHAFSVLARDGQLWCSLRML
jgi:hypothetical protein